MHNLSQTGIPIVWNQPFTKHKTFCKGTCNNLLMNGPISHKIHVSVLVVPQLETWSMSHFRQLPTNTQTKVSEDFSSVD